MKRPFQQPLTGPCMNDLGVRRPSRSKQLAIVLLAATLLVGLGGCGLLKKKRHYVKSGEIPAMKVPEGLDTPGYDPSLTVPAATSDRLLAGAELAPPPIGAAGPGVSDVDIGSGRTSASMPDNLDNAWRRVGQALDRSGAFSILERNREAGSYRIGLPAPIVLDPRPWWRRTLGWGDAPTQGTSSEVVIKLVETTPNQIRVDIYDTDGGVLTDNRAMRVIAIIEERLGLG